MAVHRLKVIEKELRVRQQRPAQFSADNPVSPCPVAGPVAGPVVGLGAEPGASPRSRWASLWPWPRPWPRPCFHSARSNTSCLGSSPFNEEKCPSPPSEINTEFIIPSTVANLPARERFVINTNLTSKFNAALAESDSHPSASAVSSDFSGENFLSTLSFDVKIFLAPDPLLEFLFFGTYTKKMLVWRRLSKTFFRKRAPAAISNFFIFAAKRFLLIVKSTATSINRLLANEVLRNYRVSNGVFRNHKLLTRYKTAFFSVATKN